MRCFKKLIVVAVISISAQAAPKGFPPKTEGAELKFNELLEGPIGERGLSLSAKAKDLDGKRVRIVGHMVRQEKPVPGLFLLSPIPMQVHEEHYGLAEDLPATTVFVSTPFHPEGIVQYQPGLFIVTGVLSVGNREEADGRISVFRVALDPPRKARKSPHVSKTGETRLGRRLNQSY